MRTLWASAVTDEGLRAGHTESVTDAIGEHFVLFDDALRKISHSRTGSPCTSLIEHALDNVGPSS